MIAGVLRGIAVAITLAGVMDPVLTVSLPARKAVAVVTIPSASMALPAAGGTRERLAQRVRQDLTSRLSDEFDIQRAPAPTTDAIVVIGDRPPASFVRPSSARAWAIDLGVPLTPNVAVTSATASDGHLSSRTRVSSHIDANGMRGRTSTIRLMAGRMVLAQDSHTWTADRDAYVATFDTASSSSLDVMRIDVAPDVAERTALDNVRSVAAYASERRFGVLFYDARPSWTTTFIRRALDSDPAFDVTFLTRVSRGISVRAAEVGSSDVFDPRTLGRVDVIVVGAPDVLTRADVDGLDRFARAGGSVLLAPDRRIDGAATTLVSGLRLQERLLEAPLQARLRHDGSIARGSEFLVPSTFPFLTERVASVHMTPNADDAAVVVRMPRGRGYVYLSGLLDAWRYRDDESRGFDIFSRDLVREAAMSAVPPITATISPRLQTIGSAVDILVRIRNVSESAVSVATQIRAPNGSSAAVRMWPASEPGTFEGTAEPAIAGTYTLRVASGDAVTTTGFAARAGRDVDPDQPAPLRAFATAHGGNVYAATDIDRLVTDLRAHLTSARERRPVHVMRSPWWIVPFAICVCSNWWWRRRRGLR